MVLVTNGRLITRDSEGKGYYEHGAVAYEGAKIVEVGEEAALRAKYADAEIVDAKGGVIMPAFINAHTHIPGTGSLHRGQQPYQFLRGAGRHLVGHRPPPDDGRYPRFRHRAVHRQHQAGCDHHL